MDLKDKRIIVTGASSGIGLELVKRFLAEGATVMAAARGIERIDLVHRRLLLKKCDISLAEEVDQIFSYALETMGASISLLPMPVLPIAKKSDRRIGRISPRFSIPM